MSNRKPFPAPTRENDFTFCGFQRLQRNTFDTTTPIAQQEEPWKRLHNMGTWASKRRSVMHYELQAPHDSLDFMLKALYNHSKEFLGDKKQVVLQQETMSKSEETGRFGERAHDDK